MDVLTIEDELLGAEPSLVKTAPVAFLADNTETKVGMTVYFTVEGAKKIVDGLFKATDAKDVEDLVAKTLTLFGQQVPPEKIQLVVRKFEEQIKTLSETPVVITAIRETNRIDVQSGPPKNRLLTNLPSTFFVAKGALRFLKRSYGFLPLWGWSLIGMGIISIAYRMRRR